MTTLPNHYTMPEAAERLGVHSNSARRTLARLGIETQKFMGQWVALKSEVDAIGEYVPSKKPKSVHKRPYLIHPDSPQRQRPVHTPEQWQQVCQQADRRVKLKLSMETIRAKRTAE